jgi:hypothetical protein
LQNSLCAIGVASSSVSVSGTDLTLNLAVAFTSAFNGTKTVNMFANSNNGLSSGWQERGAWTVAVSAPAPTPSPSPSLAPAPSVPPVVSAIDVTPSTGSASSQKFTLRYSDSRGASSLISEWVWFAGGGAGACMAYHERATNRVYLLDDTGTAWNSRALGSKGTLRSSSCTIDVGASSASVAGTDVTVNLAITFAPLFAGPKTLRMFANSAGGFSSGWQDRGSWTVPGSTPAPTPTPTPEPEPTVQPGLTLVGVNPGSGSGSGQGFALQYSDSRGARNLVSEWVWFSGGTGACMAYHERATNVVYLLNDAGTGWISGIIGTSSKLQNASCAIVLSSSSVSINGPVLTLNLAINFKETFSGTKDVRMFANALGDLTTGWQSRGSWIVP